MRKRPVAQADTPQALVARRLIAARVRRGIPQARLAEHLGVSRQRMSQLEDVHFPHAPNLQTLAQIADAIDAQLFVDFIDRDDVREFRDVPPPPLGVPDLPPRLGYLDAVEEFGPLMRAVRQHHGWSQGEFARALAMNQSNISSFESGRRGNPTLASVLKILSLFGLRLAIVTAEP